MGKKLGLTYVQERDKYGKGKITILDLTGLGEGKLPKEYTKCNEYVYVEEFSGGGKRIWLCNGNTAVTSALVNTDITYSTKEFFEVIVPTLRKCAYTLSKIRKEIKRNNLTKMYMVF